MNQAATGGSIKLQTTIGVSVDVVPVWSRGVWAVTLSDHRIYMEGVSFDEVQMAHVWMVVHAPAGASITRSRQLNFREARDLAHQLYQEAPDWCSGLRFGEYPPQDEMQRLCDTLKTLRPVR